MLEATRSQEGLKRLGSAHTLPSFWTVQSPCLSGQAAVVVQISWP